ncbi:DUF3744 domain-containing protein [[Clostridium] dakarense]|uniref:DUF3744 domain-containing protein n=1 Tax=Faecalimicrobium dakarense TaxID=1301100 RepID=UPI0004B59495|nr:DUF3744 domain-containing protein [[Clostridium] dakarense]
MDKGEIIADTTPNELLSSNILSEVGVREPLYITALKYANCNINPKLKPSSIKTLDFNACKDKINTWYESAQRPIQKPKTNTILEFDKVSFSYGNEKQVLKNLSFKVDKGDMVSIVGRNGAGKSTISKLICGFYKPVSGRILFDTKDIIDESIKKRSEKIGFVMQNPNQMISKTMVFDEVAFGLKIKGIKEDKIKEKVYKTLKTCGLYGYRNWPISALSYGQKKRVTIASILVLNPEVIILDEPTSGQDFKHYTEIMEFLVELNKKGVTVIMVTHDMHLMLEYTNNVIVLSEGEKLADDNATNILTNEDIIKKANLKETSLHELAIKCGIEDSVEFVNRFIEYDRRVRNI